MRALLWIIVIGCEVAMLASVGSSAPPPKLSAPDSAVQPARDGSFPQLLSAWVQIRAGSFLMGSPADAWGRGRYDEDQVKVTLTHDFELGRYEVTQDEWTRYGFANPSSRDPKAPATGDVLGGRNPVGTVTWFEALAFANARSERASPPRPACFELSGCTGEMGRGLVCTSVTVKAKSIYECEGYRLPTEAEWEYAARAGTQTDFYAGNFGAPTAPLEAPDLILERIAWYMFNSGKLSHPVGLKEPNAWGLYDMAGNAFEWVFDRYGAFGYGAGPLVDPTGASDGKYRVVRGGCAWTSLVGYRSAARFYGPPTSRVPLFGLRLARTLRPGERVDSKRPHAPSSSRGLRRRTRHGFGRDVLERAEELMWVIDRSRTPRPDPVMMPRLMGDTSLKTILEYYLDSSLEHMAEKMSQWQQSVISHASDGDASPDMTH